MPAVTAGNSHSNRPVRPSFYRTLLHEIGHQVDYLVSVERPHAALNPDDPAFDTTWDTSSDRYWKKSTAEKEAFAHRYAAGLGDRLHREGKLPFPRSTTPPSSETKDSTPAGSTHPNRMQGPDPKVP